MLFAQIGSVHDEGAFSLSKKIDNKRIEFFYISHFFIKVGEFSTIDILTEFYYGDIIYSIY